MFNLSKNEITFEVVENFCREWPEGVRVEYKQEITKDIPKIVSSFANTQGGVFVIGVKADQTDNKVIFPIEGIPDTAGIEERIMQSAYEGIYPSVIPEVIKVNVPETENIVVIARVDESVSAPHAIQNSTRVYIRVGSVTQPYKKPELAEIDRIEYLFKRRQDTQTVTQQILDRIENRSSLIYTPNNPTMKLIVRPVLAYHPVISAAAIYDSLYRTHAHIKRIPGGICSFIEPSRYNNHELIDNYLELNEYGIVYYIMKLSERSEGHINWEEFIYGIDKLLQAAEKLYNACDTSVNFEVIAELKNVFGKKMPQQFISGHIPLNSTPVCYASEVFASTSKTYVSRDLMDPAHQKTICEELTTQLLWAFNIPTDNENIIKLVRNTIAYHISE